MSVETATSKNMITHYNGLPDLLWLKSMVFMLRSCGVMLFMNALGPIVVCVVVGIIYYLYGRDVTVEIIMSWWVGASAAIYCIIITVIMVMGSLHLMRNPFKIINLEDRVEYRAAKYISWGKLFDRMPKLVFWMSIVFIVFQCVSSLGALGWAIMIDYTPLSPSAYWGAEPLFDHMVIDSLVILMLFVAFAVPYALMLPLTIYLSPITRAIGKRHLYVSLIFMYFLIGLCCIGGTLGIVGESIEEGGPLFIGLLLILPTLFVGWIVVNDNAIHCFMLANVMKKEAESVVEAYVEFEMNR